MAGYFEELITYTSDDDSSSLRRAGEDEIKDAVRDEDRSEFRSSADEGKADDGGIEGQEAGSMEPSTSPRSLFSGEAQKGTSSAFVSVAPGGGQAAAGITAIQSLLSSAPVDLDKILEDQDVVLSKRRMFVGHSARKKRKALAARSRLQS